ncbi:hypothetical protein BIW11_02382 [Tropilaelaps mercedesae]|uniref:G-protein coupled receptors family 1 profile domain-containing protein n=1 Tax=Tropilaelaps mercedesae TaxID=418985 RepID=A0A1V9WYA6_9ACAR|nr:hypothetical protein BIW11_02382 [Tropilaelaps mercedesae]
MSLVEAMRIGTPAFGLKSQQSEGPSELASIGGLGGLGMPGLGLGITRRGSHCDPAKANSTASGSAHSTTTTTTTTTSMTAAPKSGPDRGEMNRHPSIDPSSRKASLAGVAPGKIQPPASLDVARTGSTLLAITEVASDVSEACLEAAERAAEEGQNLANDHTSQHNHSTTNTAAGSLTRSTSLTGYTCSPETRAIAPVGQSKTPPDQSERHDGEMTPVGQPTLGHAPVEYTSRSGAVAIVVNETVCKQLPTTTLLAVPDAAAVSAKDTLVKSGSDNSRTVTKVAEEGSTGGLSRNAASNRSKREMISSFSDRLRKKRKSNDKRQKSKSENRARKALRTISFILGAFVICWTPYHICALVEGFCRDARGCVNHHLFYFTYFLCYANSPINPFCYALANQQFKRTFYRVLRGDFHKT